MTSSEGGRPRQSLSSWVWGIRVVLVSFLVATIWFAETTSLPSHQTWARIATVAYGLALVVALFKRWVAYAPALAFAGALVAPLAWTIAQGLYQPEVSVVAAGAHDWLIHGSPYLTNPTGLDDYRPYPPLMFSFGLPSLLLSFPGIGDPRVWLDGSLVLWVWALGRRSERGPKLCTPDRSSTLLLLSCPLIALELTVSAIDVPTVGLIAASIEFLDRNRPKTALCLATAAALVKPTAAIVLLLVLIALARSSRGARVMDVAIPASLSLVTIGVVGLPEPRGFILNAILFPLGLGQAASPAQSPLPGVLLARYVPGGTGLALTLTIAWITAIAVYAWRTRLPSTKSLLRVGAAALAGAYMLAPASRIGYFVVPLLLWWPTAAVGRYKGIQVRPSR